MLVSVELVRMELHQADDCPGTLPIVSTIVVGGIPHFHCIVSGSCKGESRYYSKKIQEQDIKKVHYTKSHHDHMKISSGMSLAQTN